MIAVITVTLDICIRSVLERSLRQEFENELVEETHLVADRLNRAMATPAQAAQQAAAYTDSQITIVNARGQVAGRYRILHLKTGPGGAAELPEFAAALAGKQGTDQRTADGGRETLYVAVPLRDGGAIRLSQSLTPVAVTLQRVRHRVLQASGIAFLLAMMLAALAAYLVSRRLRRIVSFAERVEQGDLTARIEEDGADEIAQVAAALDRTARRLEEMFSSMQASRQQMLTVLNSMQEPVIAVSDEQSIQWANGAMERLTAGRARPGAAVVEALRDPEFLSALRRSLEDHSVTSARVRSIAPGRVFDMTAAPMPGWGGGGIARSDGCGTGGENAAGFHRQRLPRVAHAAYLHSGILGDPAGHGAGRSRRGNLPRSSAAMPTGWAA